MIVEDYVSFETAKLLKENGFKEWCRCCYGVAVLHNGEDISFDEECDLKDEGRENEIEYVEGGAFYYFNCDNSDKDAKVWAAPTLQMAMKWLREVHNLHIEVYRTACGYLYIISKVPTGSDLYDDGDAYDGDDENSGQWTTNEKACEAAIKYCLHNLI